MSGQFVRLKDSERNALIENYRNGIVDPNYEVIPSKTTTGKYTIRRRKVSLPVEEHTEEPQQEPIEEQEPHVEVAEERGGEYRKINVEFIIMDAFPTK